MFMELLRLQQCTCYYRSAISFMLQSGSLIGTCEANNSASITVFYRESTSVEWRIIASYNPSGNLI